MLMNLVLIIIVFTISTVIFGDINYYKALFTDRLNSSKHYCSKIAGHKEETDN
jgi:hypothetical protein